MTSVSISVISLGSFKIVVASLEDLALLNGLAAKWQIKDLYISVIINFSGKESQMKQKYTWKQTFELL